MSNLIFATPWWLFGGLIAVGLVVAWTGVSQRKKGPMYVGGVLILLAIGLKTLSYFVETDEEKCERQTTELVGTVEKKDWDQFAALLDDQVSLGTGAGPIYANRAKLLDGVKYCSGKFDPKDFSMSIVHTEQDPTGVSVDINVSAEATVMMGMGGRVPTSWKLQWEREGKDWKLHEIIVTKIGNQTGTEMARDFQ